MSLPPVFEIQGIKFFNDARLCIAHFEGAHCTKRISSFIQSFWTLLVHLVNKVSLVFRGVDEQMAPFRDPTRTLSKKRLVVCVHGLNDNPSQFKKISDELKDKDLDLFIPRVLRKGNAELDEMVKPIFAEIAKWATTPGDKELVLVGVSNGGRISRAIETKIAKSDMGAKIEKLRFVSIVGACKGSSLAKRVNQLGLGRFMSKAISAEMPTDSPRNKQLDREWKEGLSKGPQREYVFIASPHDYMVPNYDSTLMDVGDKPARYALVPNHGHNSIVNAVAQSVAAIILT